MRFGFIVLIWNRSILWSLLKDLNKKRMYIHCKRKNEHFPPKHTCFEEVFISNFLWVFSALFNRLRWHQIHSHQVTWTGNIRFMAWIIQKAYKGKTLVEVCSRNIHQVSHVCNSLHGLYCFDNSQSNRLPHDISFISDRWRTEAADSI